MVIKYRNSGYVYEQEKVGLFTDEGQKVFLKVRDRAHYLLKEAGAFRVDALMRVGGFGDSFTFLACVDRLVELGEITCLGPEGRWAQHKVYTRPGGSEHDL